MSNRSIIAYQNLLWDATLTPGGLWEPDAPQENLQTPQLGEIARVSEFASVVSLDYVLTEPSRIGLIGLLAYGDGVDEVAYRLYDGLDNLLASQTATPVVYPAQGYFPRHAWLVLATPVSGVSRVEIVVGMDSGAFFQAGGVWAGPVWDITGLNPQFALDVIDPSNVVTTDANQTRANRLKRFRQLALSINDLNRRTGLGIVDEGPNDEVISNENSLIDLFMYSGISSPIVVMPVSKTVQDIHTLGIYGYLQPRLQLQVNTTAGDQTNGKNSTQLVVKESL